QPIDVAMGLQGSGRPRLKGAERIDGLENRFAAVKRLQLAPHHPDDNLSVHLAVEHQWDLHLLGLISGDLDLPLIARDTVCRWCIPLQRVSIIGCVSTDQFRAENDSLPFLSEGYEVRKPFRASSTVDHLRVAFIDDNLDYG